MIETFAPSANSAAKVQQTLELQNRDGYAEVFVHLNNMPGADSVGLLNGTQLSVIGHEDDTYLVLHNGKKYGVKDYHCKILASTDGQPHEVRGSVIQSAVWSPYPSTYRPPPLHSHGIHGHDM